ncbi:hypothetical protein AGABI2DRAFT_222487 [Agaricus bisporus var. bisporus H97]|uniref:hypothetical protein n=1 Tax=Agaricus bisporus var. bisporus (strain H97 / ATCC MYA-4626 / FGSC 10389) TaxID=936046 RepID=UPI00029F564A|nr:hypothetical protein AGABI2DRAFT_222487 [Agaricus bisporus var. bisporus H97]EKV46343.1 hypothetical protein AGABI2DRAFT_222487 [Agaricus bisporus var. bisporus H97]
MSSSTSTHPNAWASSSTSGQLGASFSDSLSQSRSHYQPGYLMSTSQDTNNVQSGQRVDDIPIVQTKAKLNNVLTRGSASEFGMESMFQSTRQRQTFADEDAPPRSSIHDIPNEIHSDSTPRGMPSKNLSPESSHLARRHARPSPNAAISQPLYVVIFGYPPEKYSLIVEYFKSLGNSTEAEPNTEVLNCFRIGYHEAPDAVRAVRKNGEVFAGSWMIGAKWAEPAQAEAALGQPLLRSSISGAVAENGSSGSAMMVDEPTQSPFTSNTPSVGTPIRLAPSTSAFRKAGAPPKPSTPLAPKPSGIPASNAATPTSNRGVLGHVSDMIFGW